MSRKYDFDDGTLSSNLLDILNVIIHDNQLEFKQYKPQVLKWMEKLASNISLNENIEPFYQEVPEANTFLRNIKNNNEYLFWNNIDKRDEIEAYFYWILSHVIDYDTTLFDLFSTLKYDQLKKLLPSIEHLVLRYLEVLRDDDESIILNSLMISAIGSKPFEENYSFFDIEIDNNYDKKMTKTQLFHQNIKLYKNRVGNDVDKLKNILLKNIDEGSSGTIDFIVHKTGMELICDLLLVHSLLLTNSCNSITLHIASFPASPLAVTSKDLIAHIEFLANPSTSDIWYLRHVGDALKRYLFTDRLKLLPNIHWCYPSTSKHVISSEIKNNLDESSLIIVKGIKNYQRLATALNVTSISSENKFLLIEE
eukprot:gene12562-16847_t